jgi:hypothetical protein
MTSQPVFGERERVDYLLARRSTLADLFRGKIPPSEVCDAHPYLLRAAKHHGEATGRDCPVCRREKLIEVTYVYADRLKESSGAARNPKDVDRIAREYGPAAVYVVEVCSECGWNHLVTSFRAGPPDAVAPAKATAKRSRASKS